jgi:hypothetical protein
MTFVSRILVARSPLTDRSCRGPDPRCPPLPMGGLRGYVRNVAGFERVTGMSSDTQDTRYAENYPSRERTASREAIRDPRAGTTGGGGSDVSDQVRAVP